MKFLDKMKFLNPDRREELGKKMKILGVYLIIILVILKFVLSPLKASIEDKKNLLDQYLDAYKTKSMLAQRKRLAGKTNSENESKRSEKLLASLYPKETNMSVIQAKTINTIIKGAEDNGLNVINFQLLDTVASGNLSEITALIRLEGMPGAMVNLLKDISRMEMLTNIKDFRIDKRTDKFALALTLATYRIER